MDRLTQMTVFASVVDRGSFTEAANQLGIAKSTVSRHVSALELRLGVRLINRTTRRLRPTDIGQAYYERCQAIVTDAKEADRAVTDRSDTPLGVLRITAPKGWATRYLMDSVGEFLATWPGVEIELNLDDRIVDIIEEGYDLAIRVAKPSDSSLVAKKLGSSWLILVCSPEYIKRHGEPTHPDQLGQHDVISRLGGVAVATMHGPKDEVFRWPRDGRLRTNDGAAMMRALLDGVAIGYMPDFMVRKHLRSGALTRLLRDWTDESRPVYALYPHRRLLSPKVRAFLDLLGERLGSPAPWECPSGVCGQN